MKRCFFSKPASPPSSGSFHKDSTKGSASGGDGGIKQWIYKSQEGKCSPLPLHQDGLVKKSGHELVQFIYCVLLPLVHIFNMEVAQQRHNEHKFYSRHPRMHCTGAKLSAARGEISECLPLPTLSPSPKNMFLCNKDGMHALPLKANVFVLHCELTKLSFSLSVSAVWRPR